MKVIKRNGRTEELDVSKIKKYTSEAVEGLENVSLSELEVDAKIQFRDMITTEEIQQTLIKTAVEKIDVDRPRRGGRPYNAWLKGKIRSRGSKFLSAAAARFAV